MNYDRFHSKSDRIYRVATHALLGETEMEIPQSMAPMGPTLYNDYSEIQNFVRIRTAGQTLILLEEEKFYEEKIYRVDTSFFSIFDIPLISGDPKTCLKDPTSVVLSETLAKKYFDGEDPIGKTLKIGGEEKVHKITGVYYDPNPQSHIRPNAVRSFLSLDGTQLEFWGSINDYTYIVLPEGYNYKDFEPKFEEVYDKYIFELFSQFNAHADFYLQPLAEIHLHSNLDGEMETSGSMNFIKTFAAIGFFLLLIACINYMNLATARSAKRSREVGIRKAMGSYRAQLIAQFLIESVVIALLSLAISAIATFFILPFFNEIADIQLPQDVMLDPQIFVMLFLIVVFVGSVGGSYPAFYLSGFKAVEVLKGRIIKTGGNDLLRKILVFSQFSISLAMISCTWIVFDQLDYLRTKELGFNKDQVMIVPLNGEEVRKNLQVLTDKMTQDPKIEAVGSGFGVPGSGVFSMNGIRVEDNNGEFVEVVFSTIYVDKEFFPTLEIPILKGRNFSSNITADTVTALIVNEELVRYMNWDEPIGKRLRAFVSHDLDFKEMKVVGVAKNFHTRSLQEPILPLVVHNTLNNGQMIVRLKANAIQEGIKSSQKIFEEVIPNRPFEYTFVDQGFQEQYESEQKRGEVYAIFSGITIAIACLGLFGLASFTAQERRKEIGIRKAVGARTSNIVYMMSKDLIRLVLFSVVIAFPVTYYFMSEWLEGFAFRIAIQWNSFVYSALLTLLIAFISILYQAMKSAIANPVMSLRED